MNKNMGSADRIIRVIIAVIFAALYFADVVNGTLGIVLLVVGAVLVLTSIFSSCPLYSLLGISTCPVKR